MIYKEIVCKILAYIILICWLSGYSYGESSMINFSHVPGLSSNSATCVMKDSYGFMWFGTIGLDRYDGYEIVNYRFNPEEKNSLKGNQVYKIFEDSAKNLWICTDAGVNRYNRNLNNFIFFDLEHLSENRNTVLVHDIFQDKKGELWIGGTGGIYKYNHLSGDFTPQKFSPESGINLGEVFSMFEDRAGNFWIGNHKRDIFLFDRTTNRLTKFKIGDFSAEYEGNRNEIFQIFEDSNNNIWILTNLSGVYVFTPATKKLTQFTQDLLLEGKSVMINSANSIIEMENGDIWVGAGGINIYNPKSLRWRYLQNDIDDNNSISSNISPKLYADDIGYVWIATINGGMDLFIPGKKPISHYSHISNNSNSLSHNTVLDFYEDEEGIVWIGTDKGGLDRFDPSNGTFKNFPANVSNPAMLSSSAVLCLEGAKSGNIWVGTYAGGLHLFNPKTNKFKRYNYDAKNLNSPGGEHIWDVKTDPESDHLWIGILWGNRGGLDEYIPEKDLFVHHATTASTECNQKHFSVTKIFCDSRRNIWIGSYEFGIDKYSKDQNCFKSYQFNLSDPNSINSNHINDIYEDSKRRLWISTDNGINLYNYQGEYFIHFGNKEGMAGKEVQSILEDNEGNLWLGTDKGISKFNLSVIGTEITKDYRANLPENFKFFINFDGKEDLSGNEFRPASMKSSDGRLYFGGINGFNIINVSDMLLNTRKPKIVITEFRLFNEKVEVDRSGKKNSPLKKDISITDEIVLNHRQNVFSFKYVALNYSSSQKNQYAYKMEGFEDRWNEMGTQRVATYTNLPAGTYLFRVKASNDDLVWNDEGTSIRLIILPPWYQTVWFRLLISTLLFLIFYSWYLYRMSSLKKQKSILERKVKVRTLSLNEANVNLQKKQEEILTQKKELENQNVEINTQRDFLEDKNKILISQNQRITEQNDKIALYAERLHSIDQQKIQFLTNLSHEFRTPLSLIMDPTDRLLEEIKDQKSTYFLNLIKMNTSRMQRLVNQILNFVKLDTGKYTLSLSPGDLMFSVNSIVDSFEYRKSLKGIEIVCKSFSNQIPAYYSIDALEKIIYNLVSNAIKYTSENGYISLDIKQISENEFEHTSFSEFLGNREVLMLEIVLKDNGSGISKEHLEKIFDRFFQVEGQTDDSFGGSGIGLSIVKEMVEMHCGSIKVESVMGEGTTFLIRLPVGKLKPNEWIAIKNVGMNLDGNIVNPELEIQLPNERIEFENIPTKETEGILKPSILIVEDDADLRSYLIHILLKDYHVYSANNGIEGLKISRADIPDLIISDVMMPGMSGIELCEKIKTDQFTNHIPVILLTAKSNSDQILEGYKTGADAYITKPFESKLLIARIGSLIKLRTQLQNKYRGEIGNILISIHEKNFDDPFLQKATEIVENNLSESYFDGEKLAKEMSMSLRQLYRKMEAITNQTVNEFIRSVQLKKSAQFLIEGKYNISEVCYLIGMSNPQYFSTLFKKHFGMSPTEFVKKRNGTKVVVETDEKDKNGK